MYEINRRAKSDKSTLLEVFQSFGISSAAIRFLTTTSGHLHLPSFTCKVFLPSIPMCSFQEQVDILISRGMYAYSIFIVRTSNISMLLTAKRWLKGCTFADSSVCPSRGWSSKGDYTHTQLYLCRTPCVFEAASCLLNTVVSLLDFWLTWQAQNNSLHKNIGRIIGCEDYRGVSHSLVSIQLEWAPVRSVSRDS